MSCLGDELDPADVPVVDYRGRAIDGAGNAMKLHGADGMRVTIRRGEEVGVGQNVIGDPRKSITICLTRSDDDTAAARLHQEVNAPLVGELNYGTIKGLEAFVRFDWINGLLLTLPTGNFSMKCIYPALAAPDLTPTPNLTQQVGMMIVDGTRPAAMGSLPQARLTTFLGSVNAAAAVLVPCPNRSHAVRLLVSRPNLYGSYRVGFSPAINVGREEYFLDPTEADEMPLAAGTRAVTVTNNSALATRITLQWSLSL